MILMDDLLGLGKVGENSKELFKIVYPDLAQPATKKVGYALETVFDFANTILLPMKLVNERSKVYFQKHMENYKDKLSSISENKLGKVTPEIGLPIIDHLLKVTNEDIADLFTNLLVSATSIDTSQNAHPSFIDVIKNLSGDEARIIKYFSENLSEVLFIQLNKLTISTFREKVKITPEYNNLNDLVDLNFNEKDNFYMINLIKLGIFEREDSHRNYDEEKYEILLEKHKDIYDYSKMKIEDLNRVNPIQHMVDITRGRYIITKYGSEFLESVSFK